MANEDGGPAFPYSVVNCCPKHGDDVEPNKNGMTLRDYFAAQALCGLGSDGLSRTTQSAAQEAYELADAMIAERLVNSDRRHE